jgi:cobalamin synthase
MVAFVLSVLCLIAFFLAVVFAEGWAALGWIAIAIVFAVATLLFTAIAQTIFWKNGDGIPAFMILPLIISVFAIYVMVRLLIDRFMRV